MQRDFFITTLADGRSGAGACPAPLRAHRVRGVVLALFLAALVLSCAQRDELILASTTSTFDSGLLDVLLPAFERSHEGISVKLIAVGSGEAMALGRRGDADVLLVHSPADEAAFMEAGYGRTRHAVMSNDYIIVGPPDDPAGVRGAASVAEALRRIARVNASFVSRGDSSGTHRKELRLWRDAGISAPPRVQIGQGMGEALSIASERGAYTLSDRGTYLALRGSLQLEVVHEGDGALMNPYHVITVHGSLKEQEADLFARWMTSERARRLIGEFTDPRSGQPLFIPTEPAH